MNRTEALPELESRIGYTFRNAELLETALTHSSFANEHMDGDGESNEKLEFLGDAVTGLEVAFLIFEKGPYLTEGQMTSVRAALVRTEGLAGVARRLELGRFLRLGVGAGRTEVSENNAVLEDAFEALVAAVFLDGGTRAVRRMIRRLFADAVDDRIREFARDGLAEDYKSRLQVELQKNGAADIRYIVLEEYGPAHEKFFRVAVFSGEKELGRGEGKTKKLAEKMAAKMALEGSKCI